MDVTIRNLVSQNEDLAKLRAANENERSLASINLYYYMREIVNGNSPADMLVIYDGVYDIYLDGIKSKISIDEKEKIFAFTKEANDNIDVTSLKWDFVTINDKIYLYKLMLSDNRAIGVFHLTDNIQSTFLTQENGKRSIVLADQNGSISKVWGNDTEILAENNVSDINKEKYYEIKREIVAEQLIIYCYTSKADILQQTHASMVVVAVTVGLSVFFMLFIFRYTKKEIAEPMKRIVIDMEKIKNGDYQNRVSNHFHTSEFMMLQETTNQMIDEIVGLKIHSYEKMIELQEMELKSIRLQLKPHFFLNALTTISSLSSQSKNNQIKSYIEALVKNVRYMFRSGFHTVPVREEVRHVKNYFEMQELKYPNCIFYMIDLPEELAEWKIPQMLIHTFIENEYKYAVSIEKTLTILIKMSKQFLDNEEVLAIEIEDDGNGYSKEVLDYMNGVTQKTGEPQSRIGLWSVKRLLSLMYERDDLLVLENVAPHGCLNKIFIPKRAKHELAEETIQTKI